MEGYREEVISSKDYNNYKLTADKVIEKLDSIREERTKSRRRWIWELMQNAKDTPNKYNQVSIGITLNENSLIFSHNGDPFEVGNITGLIQQVSHGKPSSGNNRRVTGKFGTGFISTHLLSDIVSIEGIVEKHPLPPKKFKIELNRKGETSEELIPAIKEEFEKLEDIEGFESIVNYHKTRTEIDRPTKFTYPLIGNKSKEAAIVGLEDLSNTLPQTMIFLNDQIKEVIVDDQIKNQVITYQRKTFQKIDDLNGTDKIIHSRIVKKTGENAEDYNFVFLRNQEIDLAVQIDSLESRKLIVNEKSPNLFKDFPLVGTEDFYFPFILNGTKFNPTERRDNVFLEGSEKKPLKNRDIFEYTINKSKAFINWILNNGFSNLSSLAISRIPEQINGKSVKDWFTKNIQSRYRSFLVEQPIVQTDSKLLTINEAILPKVNGSDETNEVFWEIVSAFIGVQKVCRKEDLKKWHKYIGPSNELLTWGDNIFFGLNDLLDSIQSKGELDKLTSFNEGSKIDWLNKLFNFIIETENVKLFDKYKVIPTISGQLKSFKDGLFAEHEGIIPDHFISILKELKEDWNNILLHRDIIKLEDLRTSKSVNDISEEINAILSETEKNEHGVIQKSFCDKTNSEKILLEILRVFPSYDYDPIHKRLFFLAKEFFGFECDEIIISESSKFTFHFAMRETIKLINNKIEKSHSLNGLELESPISWLKEYLFNTEKLYDYKYLLEYGNIVPNRRGEFLPLKDIRGFGTEESPLDDTLICILSDLNNDEDWNSLLIHDQFRELNIHNKKFDELANKILSELQKLNRENNYPSKSDSILRLNSWCTQNPLLAEKYFKSFLDEKDRILVNISLEDKKVGKDLVKLLSTKEDLGSLVSISESGVNLTQLSEIAQIAKSIDLNEIKNYAWQLLDEKSDFEYKKEIGEGVEAAFIDAFKSLNLPYEIYYQGIGDQDIIIKNPINNKSFYIELKSLSPKNNNDYLRLSTSQAKKAYKQFEEGNYVISVLVRPIKGAPTTSNYIKDKLITQFELGKKLKNVVKKNKEIKKLLNSDDDIDLVFEDTRRKVKVSGKIWNKEGRSFEELIEKIMLYLG